MNSDLVFEATEYTLYLAALVENTLSEGPFTRCALWVQGCSIRCPACCNPSMQDFAAGSLIALDCLEKRILAIPGIEGVTLLGGEPFDQAVPLGLLAGRIRSQGLGVITFSGYKLENLRQRPEAAELLAASDLLIDGPFRQTMQSSRRRYIGSDNQRLHFLTSRYRGCPEFNSPGQGIHLTFEEDSMTITGFPALFPDLDRFPEITGTDCKEK